MINNNEQALAWAESQDPGLLYDPEKESANENIN